MEKFAKKDMAEYISSREIKEIPIENIIVSDKRITGLNEQKIEELMVSICEIGLTNPITVYINPASGQYVLLCGNHRLTACKRLKIEYVMASVLEFDEGLTFEQKVAVANLVETSENLTRNIPTIDALFLMYEEERKDRAILPKDFKMAKTKKKELEASLEFLKGKDVEVAQKKIDYYTTMIEKGKANAELEKNLTELGYSQQMRENMMTIHEASVGIEKGDNIFRTLKEADVEPVLYKTLANEIKLGNKDIMVDILSNNSPKSVRHTLVDIKNRKALEKERAKREIELKNNESDLNIEEIFPNYIRINDKIDIVTTEREERFMRNGYELIVFERLNPHLRSTVYHGLNNQFRTLVSCANKRGIDALINNLKNNYKKRQ